MSRRWLAAGVLAVVAVAALAAIGGWYFLLRDVAEPASVGDAIAAFVAATLRAMEEAKRSFRARVVNAVLTVVCGAVGLRAAGAEGGAWGIATANALSVPFWWWHLLRAARRRPEMTGVAAAEVVGEPAV